MELAVARRLLDALGDRLARFLEEEPDRVLLLEEAFGTAGSREATVFDPLLLPVLGAETSGLPGAVLRAMTVEEAGAFFTMSPRM
mgnify:CR=1 FL=1